MVLAAVLAAVLVLVPLGVELEFELEVGVQVQLLVVGSPVEFPPGGVFALVHYGIPFLLKNWGRSNTRTISGRREEWVIVKW